VLLINQGWRPLQQMWGLCQMSGPSKLALDYAVALL
jgi:hypothetical protein